MIYCRVFGYFLKKNDHWSQKNSNLKRLYTNWVQCRRPTELTFFHNFTYRNDFKCIFLTYFATDQCKICTSVYRNYFPINPEKINKIHWNTTFNCTFIGSKRSLNGYFEGDKYGFFSAFVVVTAIKVPRVSMVFMPPSLKEGGAYRFAFVRPPVLPSHCPIVCLSVPKLCRA